MNDVITEMITLSKELSKEEKELLLQINYRKLACDYLRDFNKKCQEYENLQLENQRLKERFESKLQSCEEANKSLRRQISEDNRALEEEHDDMFNRPTVLAAKLGALGYQGELTRKQPFYNMDEKMGEYTETLTIGTNGKA
jgi:capsule polysaccharide export protein KpsE/RkpR